MATPTDVAIVHTDHEFEKPQSGQRSATSPKPLNATVEEYTSEEEKCAKDHKKKDRLDLVLKNDNERKDHQRKSTIKVSTIPKQANVSWYDRDLQQSKSQASSNERGSMFSQASTVVPPVVPSYPYPYLHEDAGTYNAYESTSNRDQVYPVSHLDNVVTSWDRLRHAVPSPRPSRPSGPSASTANEPSSLAVSKQSPLETQSQYTEAFSKEGAKLSAKFEELLQNFQQALKQHSEEQRIITSSERTSPASATSVTEEESLSDLDLIKAMEERIQGLKRKNEEKLIEANQVLRYLAQRFKPEQRDDNNESASSHIDGAKVTYAKVPMVYRYQTLEEESTSEDAGKSSVDSDKDSIAGNSSGSSISSLVPASCRIQPSSATTGRQYDRITNPESEESDDDLSISGTESEDKSAVGRGEPESSNARVTVNEDPGRGIARSAVMMATELDMMGELIALRRDLHNLKRQTDHNNNSWFRHAMRSTLVQFRKYFRQRPRPGRQRLEWTCECGEAMYADLPIENAVQHQQMLEFLTRPEPTTQQTNSDQRTPSQLEGGTPPADYSSLRSSQSSLGNGLPSASTIGSGSTYVGTGSSQIFTTQQNNDFGQSKYLELCVNISKYETKLAEIQVLSGQSIGTAICTDAHLFRQIYQRYYALRKHNLRRFLYRPAGIKFVHFGVQAGEQVSFFSSDPLPPEDEISAKRYEYNPQPPVPPPIDSRTFLHYFYNHNAYTQSTSAKYMNRLPKKLGGSLTRSLGADDLLEGWGIHIIEGPNKVAICWALFLVLVASLAVSIVYDSLTRSEESGFAIGQWMVAALTVGLSALYFSLEDDVNTSFD